MKYKSKNDWCCCTASFNDFSIYSNEQEAEIRKFLFNSSFISCEDLAIAGRLDLMEILKEHFITFHSEDKNLWCLVDKEKYADNKTPKTVFIAKNDSDWIPVTEDMEHLPIDSEDVLVTIDFGGEGYNPLAIAFCRKYSVMPVEGEETETEIEGTEIQYHVDWYFSDNSEPIDDNRKVIAWQPLPKAYSAEVEEDE